ncbi:MAG TPA: hypothetical protein VHW09_14505 [Bryobacteraceae bacterium]|jgi:hypothetical protein|nr:hypothetical protein [Bryobacteraceae bacterium]
MRLLLVLFFLGHPFWETKPPDHWSDREIESLRTDSPWAQSVGPDPKVLVYLATAAPIEDAEEEARLRTRSPLAEPDPDYLDYLRENGGKCFVLALDGVTRPDLDRPGEQKALEEQTEMVIGRKTYKIIGSFPPTEADPVLRLVFPRVVDAGDKSVLFHLYLPGVAFPERDTEFRVKDLLYHGKVEM